MENLDTFRQKLAAQLHGCAGDRKRRCGPHPTGEDLKIIARFEGLAVQATALDATVFQDVERVCADPDRAREFDAVRRDLPRLVGMTIWPSNAADLVRWMLDHVGTSAGPARGRVGFTRTKAVTHRSFIGDRAWTGFVATLIVALAIISPMLAIWQISAGLSQWRDQAFAASHPTVSGTVLATLVDPGGRAAPAETTTVISFTPPNSTYPCQATLRLPNADVVVGQTVDVVPRSAICQTPILPGQLGRPGQSFALASLFAAIGLLTLRLWLRQSASRVGLRGRQPITRRPALRA